MMSGTEALVDERVHSGGSRGEPQVMNEAEFELFYRTWSRPLWGYLARITSDPSLADDLFQKTFFRFARAADSRQDDKRLKKFLFTIASNLLIDHWRQTGREREAMKLQDSREPVVEPRPLLRHDLQKVFAELEPRDRLLLWMAHVEGEDHRSIGKALDVKEKSVKVLLFRARKRLAALLQEHGGYEVNR